MFACRVVLLGPRGCLAHQLGCEGYFDAWGPCCGTVVREHVQKWSSQPTGGPPAAHRRAVAVIWAAVSIFMVYRFCLNRGVTGLHDFWRRVWGGGAGGRVCVAWAEWEENR